MDETFRKVQEYLSKFRRGVTVTLDTELYYDLGMFGNTLDWDLVLWAHREFGVERNLRSLEYGPGNVASFAHLYEMIAKPLGLRTRQYKSLKVRDVMAAIEAKRWPD
jgi:hypothetical protein